jgi:predicted TPR repeat methyltransferase
MNCEKFKIRYPEKECTLDQDEEWVTIVAQDSTEKIKLHDYEKFYEIPGLYEKVIYDKLKCDSHRVICELLNTEIEKAVFNKNKLRVLDFGAGNGVVGECLDKVVGCQILVGFDIIQQARDAVERDRPKLYDQYYVMDISQMDECKQKILNEWNFNALVTVGALGYGDIPPQAFINAFNTIEDRGWIAFNIKDRFLNGDDDTGYKDTLKAMMGDCLEVLQKKRYCHRLSLSGESLYYYAIIGRKVNNTHPYSHKKKA